MIQIEIAAEKIAEIMGFPVTNTLLMGWISVLILGAGAYLLFTRISIVPSLPQNIFEVTIEKLVGLMEGVFGSKERAERYFPIVATIFLFILFSNWLGIFPGIGSVGLYKMHGDERIFVPLFRSAASDLNFTIALAVSVVVAINIFGISAIGLGRHLSRFFTLRSPIDFFVGLLEFISEIAKMISFAFRLFGNVFAGEVLLVITAFLVPYFIPVPFLLLEIFVGFVQALVFSMLTMVFISIAVQQH